MPGKIINTYLKITIWFGLIFTSIGAYGQDWVRVINLRGEWNFSLGDNNSWAHQYYNDDKWEKIRVPSSWEDEGFHGYDGYAWYRKKFDGRELDKGRNYYIHMGYIDDTDQAFINGKLVGQSGSFPPNFNTAFRSNRIYPIPTDFINYTGSNTVSVRVYDAYIEGGIISGRPGIYYDDSEDVLDLDLSGIWDFFIEDFGRNRDDLDDEEWSKIMVPSPWEKQGIRNFDGIGWYRKKFQLPDQLNGHELVLLVGKIDDFDQVYLNGTLIGKTKDDRRFSFSTSYLELRIYNVPKNLIKPGQLNTLVVRVEDIGNIGGIYEGPVGLIKASRRGEFRFR